MLRRIGLALVLSAVAVGAFAGAASADPVNTKNGLLVRRTAEVRRSWPRSTALVTCSVDFTQQNPFGTMHLVGTVTVLHAGEITDGGTSGPRPPQL